MARGACCRRRRVRRRRRQQQEGEQRQRQRNDGGDCGSRWTKGAHASGFAAAWPVDQSSAAPWWACRSAERQPARPVGAASLSRMSDSRVWFITGTTSGFGRAIAEAALERGDSVVATARRIDALADLGDPERVQAVRLDVTDAGDREAAVAAALDRFGRIDVLVNNAGRTQVGAIEETTDEELRALFDLHFFGPAALTRLVLPADAGAARRRDRADVERRRPDHRARLRRLLRYEVRARGPDRDAARRGPAVRHPHADRRAGGVPHRPLPPRRRLHVGRDGRVRGDRRPNARVRARQATASRRATRPRRPPRSSPRSTPTNRRCGSCSAPTRSATSAPASTPSEPSCVSGSRSAATPPWNRRARGRHVRPLVSYVPSVTDPACGCLTTSSRVGGGNPAGRARA